MIAPTRADDDALRELAGRMRNPAERLADLRAQRAANLTGARRLAELVERHGADGLRAGMAEILDYAERRTRAATRRAARRRRTRPRTCSRAAPTAPTTSTLRVRATIAGDALRLDFAGTERAGRGQPQLPALGDQVGGLLRRPRAHRPRRAAVGGRAPADRGGRARGLAAQRALAGRGRGGQRRDLEPGRRPRDRGARRRAPAPAQGQGTMNNLTLASEGWTYYETIGGGQGACPDADGPSAVHVAMSNTLNTPIEALETEFPRPGPRAGAAARLRRRRPPPRRRRDRARARGAGADALHADHRAPPPPAARPRRRRRRRARPQPAQRRGAAREVRGRARPRRPPTDRDPGRRRARPSEPVHA